MELYTVIAYLPTSENALVRNQNQEPGFWRPRRGFQAVTESIVKSALAKYGYIPVKPATLAEEQIPDFLSGLDHSY